MKEKNDQITKYKDVAEVWSKSMEAETEQNGVIWILLKRKKKERNTTLLLSTDFSFYVISW